MKKLIGILICIAIIISMCSGCNSLETVEQGENQNKIALIAMDQADFALEEGAMKAAAELGTQVVSMAAEGLDPAQQISDAVSSGYRAMVIAAEDLDAVAASLEEAESAGVKIVYVNASEANAGRTVYTTDNEAAGKAVGERMLKMLKDRGITSGVIGMIGKDSKADLLREEGFQSVFEAEQYTLMDTLTKEDDPERFAFIAGNYIDNGAAALFCCSESATVGAGQAMKLASTDAVIMGFGQTENVKQLVDDGYIQAFVMQNFDMMGYEGVKAAYAALNGEVLDGGISDTGITIIETEAPDIDALLTGDFHDCKIALITVDGIDWNWRTLEEGALKAADELGCELVNLSPGFPDEKEQIKQIYHALNEDADAIIIAAHHSEEVYAALEDAIGAGVRVICVDTSADVKAEATYITDSKAAGRTAGEIMLHELKVRKITEGTIGILGISDEDKAGLQLEEGFREIFEGTNYTLSETHYSEADAALSHAIANDCIDKFAVGIFCCSEGAVIGAGNAVKHSGEDITVVGVGMSKNIWEMIEAGVIQATVTPDFENMGYEAVRAACVALKGGKLNGETIDVGAYILK